MIRRPKINGSLFLSLALHAVMGVGIIKVLLMPYPFYHSADKGKDAVRPERIGFLRLPEASPSAAASAGQSGGDGRTTKIEPAPKLIAPLTVPTGIPVPVPQVPASEGSGPLVGRGGPVRGITPAYYDPRVWRAPDNVLSAPKTAAQRLDSAVVAFVQPLNDSAGAQRGGRDPADWTFEKGGRKYGVDRKFIRLGPVSIPTALLALLPMNVTGNPTVMERERSMNALNRDIMYQAQRGMNEADFQKAVRSIRVRKERERAESDKAEKKKDRPGSSQ